MLTAMGNAFEWTTVDLMPFWIIHPTIFVEAPLRWTLPSPGHAGKCESFPSIRLPRGLPRDLPRDLLRGLLHGLLRGLRLSLFVLPMLLMASVFQWDRHPACRAVSLLH